MTEPDDKQDRLFAEVAKIRTDVAVIRTKMESVLTTLDRVHVEHDGLDTRLQRVERRLFSIWIAGPVLLALAAWVANMKKFWG